MARRRSVNRRRSRRSSNMGDLDQNSEVLDAENVMWWKDISDTTMLRPSAQTSFAETTAPILGESSLFDGSELQDRWWDNLDRTSIQSSRRFSRRKSVNPKTVEQQSIQSEGEAESMAKRRKIETESRTRRSRVNENSDNSIVAHSEPMPTEKRKTRSPAKSDAAWRKTRDSLVDPKSAINTLDSSNEIPVESASKTFAKRATILSSSANDEILANQSLRMNFGKNVSRISESSITKNFVKPRTSVFNLSREEASNKSPNESQRSKRFASITKKLDMSAEELNASVASGKSSNATTRLSKSSKTNKTPRDSKTANAEKNYNEMSSAKAHARDTEQTHADLPINEVEKILEIHDEERRSRSTSTEKSKIRKRRTKNKTMEKTDVIDDWMIPDTQETPAKSANRTKKSTMIEESMMIDELPEESKKKRGSSSTMKRNSKVPTRQSTIDEESVENVKSSETMTNRLKSTSTIEENLRQRKQSEASKSKNSRSMGNANSTKKSFIQLFDESEASEIDDDDDKEEPTNRVYSNSSLTKKSLSTNKLSMMKSVRDVDESEKETDDDDDDHEAMRETRKRYRKSYVRQHPDSAYELPDKERSGSLEISVSENEMIVKQNSLDASSRGTLIKHVDNGETIGKSVDRSLVDGRSNTSRQIVEASGLARTIDKSGRRIDENKSAIVSKTISGNNIENATSHEQQQLEDSDQSISEELAIGSQQLNPNFSRKMSRSKTRVDDFEKPDFWQADQNDRSDDESISEEFPINSQPFDLKRSTINIHEKSKINDSRLFQSRQDDHRREKMTDDDDDDERQPRTSKKSTSIASRDISRSNKKIDSEKSVRKEHENRESRENPMDNISEAETEIADNENLQMTESDQVSTAMGKKSFGRMSEVVNYSQKIVESDESISEEEYHEQPDDGRSKNASRAGAMDARRSKDASRAGAARRSEFSRPGEKQINNEVDTEEDAENFIPVDAKTMKKNVRSIISKSPNATNHDHNRISTIADTNDASTTIPSTSKTPAPLLAKLPSNKSARKSKTTSNATQRVIDDFFPSNFLRKIDNTTTSRNFGNVDDETLERIRKEVETKRRQLTASIHAETTTKKQQPIVAPRTVKKAVKKPSTTTKVVDKAYIVNGQVYKRPKLPRPRPWATDRLYRYLWKKMEAKYGVKTRVRSEKFVVELAEVVKLTERRKKYENYKDEVDGLMMKMARLGIVKTRNDFYDFCYDYLPYEFRSKVTPMLLPGSVHNIPYDPSTLHTPLITEP